MNGAKYSFEVDGDKITIVRRDNIDQIDPSAIQLQILLNPQPHAIEVNREIEPEHDEEYYFGPNKFEVDIVHDEDYYLNMIQFEAGGLLYNVPSGLWPFPISSEQRNDNQDLNSSEDVVIQSIKCDGVEKQDVELMHTLIEYLHHAESPEHSMPFCTTDWIRILHCASLWGFQDHRLRAIRVLEDAAEVTPFEKLDLARKYGIEQWALSFFRNYANITQALDEDTLVALGPLASTRITGLREQKRGEQLKQVEVNGRGIWKRRYLQSDPSILATALNGACHKLQMTESPGKNNAVENILLAKELPVMGWLESSFIQFMKQPSFPSETDIARLNISPQCIVAMFRAREMYVRRGSSNALEYALPALKMFIAETGINPITMGPARRLSYAHWKGYVGWFREACTEFISRKGAITFEETKRLSTDEYCAIAIAREEYRCQIYQEPNESKLSLSEEEANQIATWVKEDLQVHQICSSSDVSNLTI